MVVSCSWFGASDFICFICYFGFTHKQLIFLHFLSLLSGCLKSLLLMAAAVTLPLLDLAPLLTSAGNAHIAVKSVDVNDAC